MHSVFLYIKHLKKFETILRLARVSSLHSFFQSITLLLLPTPSLKNVMICVVVKRVVLRGSERGGLSLLLSNVSLLSAIVEWREILGNISIVSGDSEQREKYGKNNGSVLMQEDTHAYIININM